MLFSLGTMYSRLSIEIEGKVISRQFEDDPSGPHRWVIDSEIRQKNGKIVSYTAGYSDPVLSRDIQLESIL